MQCTHKTITNIKIHIKHLQRVRPSFFLDLCIWTIFRIILKHLLWYQLKHPHISLAYVWMIVWLPSKIWRCYLRKMQKNLRLFKSLRIYRKLHSYIYIVWCVCIHNPILGGPLMHTHPKRYSQNECKTLDQKTTASKCSCTLVAVRKSVPLLYFKYLLYHLQCKNTREYNTQ